jgi:hypothetical protein
MQQHAAATRGLCCAPTQAGLQLLDFSQRSTSAGGVLHNKCSRTCAVVIAQGQLSAAARQAGVCAA